MSDIVRSLENAEKVFHRVYQLAISTGGIYVLDVEKVVGSWRRRMYARHNING